MIFSNTLHIECVGKRKSREAHFSCRYNNQPVFTAEFGPGVAANPFLAFYLQASSSGELLFSWTDQHGNVATATRNLQVVDG